MKVVETLFEYKLSNCQMRGARTWKIVWELQSSNLTFHILIQEYMKLNFSFSFS